MRKSIRLFSSAAVLGVAGPAAIFAAPGAGAAVTGVTIDAGPEGLRAGCPYTVTATVDAPPSEAGPITIINSGGAIGGNGNRLGEAEYHPDNGTATFRWVPEQTGRQNITAQQFTPGEYTSSKYIEVDVRSRGIDTGSACLPLP
ncbi:hypothetical protein [Nocardia sp. CA-290969]|uniref:hypothetical protein n=1 Tax=Nocardia sp. CA-290969 TaxID=3239986 RepID=UPI003D91E9C9